MPPWSDAKQWLRSLGGSDGLHFLRTQYYNQFASGLCMCFDRAPLNFITVCRLSAAAVSGLAYGCPSKLMRGDRWRE
jgi:hypothetical protein